MEEFSWTDRVKNEQVSQKVKEEGNTLHAIKRSKGHCFGYILRRNCLLEHVIQGKVEGAGRRGRRRKHPLDDLKEARRYLKLKEETLDRTLWRSHFGRGYRLYDTALAPVMRSRSGSPEGNPRQSVLWGWWRGWSGKSQPVFNSSAIRTWLSHVVAVCLISIL
jgi:hypothetical protein